MRTKDFSYDLPDELIAQHPLASRTNSRLLVAPSSSESLCQRADHLIDMHVRDLGNALLAILGQRLKRGPCALVVNDTRVYPARLFVRKVTGARIEVFVLSGVHEALVHGSGAGGQVVDVLLRPQKKLREGDVLLAESSEIPQEDLGPLQDDSATTNIPDGASSLALFEVVRTADDVCQVRCLRPLSQILELFGQMPLPPYIRRAHACNDSIDRERYQTVYAREAGSAAAPTAGLHLTSELVQELCSSGLAELVPVTLHVGLGTFRPVQAAAPENHQMHEERYFVSSHTLQRLVSATAEGRGIVYIGTTSFRAVESFCQAVLNAEHSLGRAETRADEFSLGASKLTNRWLSTDLFVYPKVAEAVHRPCFGHGMMTNFHQPESTLLMLVSALAGVARMRQVYAHALREGYRFLSYGDASLLGFVADQRLQFSRT